MGISWSALMGSFTEQLTTNLDCFPIDLKEKKRDLGRDIDVGDTCKGFVDRLRD